MPTTTTIRVSVATRERLQRLASEQSRPIGRIIDTLLDDDEKRAFFAGLGEDFARLRADPDALKSDEEEVAVWDATRKDGLEDQWSEE